MIANVQASVGTTLQLRVRAAGTDQTAAGYFSFGFSGGFGAVTQLNLATQTSSRIHQISGDLTNYFIMDISKPNENTPTIFDITAYYPDNGSHMTQTSIYNNNFQADSLTIFPASGTITGTYSVYGYNK